jgi:hypothetical protein
MPYQRLLPIAEIGEFGFENYYLRRRAHLPELLHLSLMTE